MTLGSGCQISFEAAIAISVTRIPLHHSEARRRLTSGSTLVYLLVTIAGDNHNLTCSTTLFIVAWIWTLEAPDSHLRRDAGEESDHTGTLHETRRYLCGQLLQGMFLASPLSPVSNDASRQDCTSNGHVATDLRWQIGMPGGITQEEVKVIGAIHVSAGCWMPIIQLTRYVF